MKRTLIVGSGGFIGSHLHARFPDASAIRGREHIDLLDAAQVAWFFKQHGPFGYVFFCAAVGGRRTRHDDEAVFAANVSMFDNVARNEDCFDRLVHFTSGAALDRAGPITADTELGSAHIQDPYGRAKQHIELRHRSSQVIHIRVFGCFGIGESESRIITSSIRAHACGIPIIIPQDRVFGMVHVDELVDLCARMVLDDVPSTTLVACNRDPVTLADLARMAGAEPVVLSSEMGLPYTGRGNSVGLPKQIALLAEAMRHNHAVIFGAGGSIGGAIAARFRADGWQVSCVGHQDALLQDWPPRWLAGVNVVVWAGGLNTNDGVGDFDSGVFDAMMQGNCKFVVETAHKLWSADKIAYGARLCAVSSVWQTHTRPGKLSYTCSKGALGAAVRALAADMAPRQVLVNAVLPGAVDNEMTRCTMPQAAQQQVRDRTGFHRMISVQEVANAVWALTHTYTGITGQSIPVDLGLTTNTGL